MNFRRWLIRYRVSLIACGGWVVLMTGCGRADPKWEKTRGKSHVEILPQALEELRDEVKRETNSSEARVRLGNEFLSSDYLRDAAEEYRKAIQLDPQNVDALMGLWQVAARLNDTANTLVLAQRAGQLDPSSPNARVALQEAARTFDQALSQRPADPWLLLNAALCQAKMQQWDRAEDYTRRAIAAVPGAITPRLMLGNLYMDQNLVDQAAEQFEQLANDQPNNALVHEALGRIHRARGEGPDAMTEFQLAQRLRPEWVVPYLEAADIALHGDDLNGAEQHFTKALQIDPQSFAAKLGLVQVLTSQGKSDHAIELCEQMLQDHPHHPMVLNNLAFLYAEHGQNLPRAIEIATQLGNSYGNSPVITDTVGWVFYRAGKYEDATRYLQRAVRLAPGNGLTSYHFAKALLAVGRRADAVTALHNALAHGLPPTEKADAETLLASSK
jgi:tetratricopeptide (TPR) repeat protein